MATTVVEVTTSKRKLREYLEHCPLQRSVKHCKQLTALFVLIAQSCK